VRSLAAFRICLAFLLLVDLFDRGRDLRAHYADWGVLPRAPLLDLFLHPYCFSLHFINGTWQWQLFLFLLAGLFALALLLGYRTRLMTVGSWVLLVSLHNRNPFVLQGGDTLLRMSLFWAMFLPLGDRWSLDRQMERAASMEREPQRVLTWATVAVLGQVMLVYVCAGLMKTGPEWVDDHTAVYYAMSVDHLTTPLGHRLLEYPELMRALTYLTVKIELFAPLLLIVPIYTTFFRSLAILLLFGLQMRFGATIRIFLFPWICCVALLPLIPSAFWEKLLRSNLATRWISGATKRTPMRLIEWLRRGETRGSPPGSTPRWVNLTAAFSLVYVVLWNLGTLPESVMTRKVGVPESPQWIAMVLRVDQRWDMFAPRPLKDDGWYVIPGTLVDGRDVDVFRGGAPVTWTKPKLVAYTYKNQRWQRYMVNLWNRDLHAFRRFYGRYLCRSWNEGRTGGAQLDRFTIYFMREDTLPHGEDVPRRVTLWNHFCFGMPKGSDEGGEE